MDQYSPEKSQTSRADSPELPMHMRLKVVQKARQALFSRTMQVENRVSELSNPHEVKDFPQKFNQKTRKYNWRGDSKNQFLFGKNTVNLMNTAPGSRKSYKNCFKNLVKYKNKENSLRSSSSKSKNLTLSKKKEGFKGITSRHLNFLNKTLNYGSTSKPGGSTTKLHHRRNSSASRIPSSYKINGKSSRGNYLNSTVNNGCIKSRLREIDQKIADAKRTAFCRAGPLYSKNGNHSKKDIRAAKKHQRSSSMGYGMNKGLVAGKRRGVGGIGIGVGLGLGLGLGGGLDD